VRSAELSAPTPPAAQPEAVTASVEHLEHRHRALPAVAGRIPRTIQEAGRRRPGNPQGCKRSWETRCGIGRTDCQLSPWPAHHRHALVKRAAAPVVSWSRYVRHAAKRWSPGRRPGAVYLIPPRALGLLLACSAHPSCRQNEHKAHNSGERSFPHTQPKPGGMPLRRGESARSGGSTRRPRALVRLPMPICSRVSPARSLSS
jgi:hypothetical protein